jgi:hypothetical protein
MGNSSSKKISKKCNFLKKSSEFVTVSDKTSCYGRIVDGIDGAKMVPDREGMKPSDVNPETCLSLDFLVGFL